MSDKSFYSNSFYSLLTIGCISIFGSGYYLYSLYKSPKKEKSSFCQDNISLSYKGNLTVEIAIKLIANLHNNVENYIKKIKPEIDDFRRSKINDSSAYEEVIHELDQLKHEAYTKFKIELERKYGYTYDQITKVLDPICPIEMEEKLTLYSMPKFEDKNLLNKKLILDAFIYYANRYIDQIKEFQNLPKEENSEDQKQKILYNFMIIKYKADDELYLKYHLTEHQLKYLLFEYKLHKDKQIEEMLIQISQNEEFFNN